MKKRNLVILLSIIFNCNAFSLIDFFSYFWPTKKTVTFLVYMAADNNLNEYINDDLNEMQRVGSTYNLNLLVHLNTRLHQQEKVTKKLVVHKGYIEQYGTDKMKDSGDPETLISACKWALKHYPAEQFVLVLWNHGSGSINRTISRSVCYDDTTGNYLTDYKLVQALEQVIQVLGKKIDIIAFDACLMADLEIAYAIKNYAHYMVASQETIPGTGFGYDYALEDAAKKWVHPYQLTKMIVHAYEKEYAKITNNYTLSAINLAKLDLLTANTNRIAEQLTKALHKNYTETYKYIRYCIRRATRFDKKYVDMFDFYSILIKHLSNITSDPLIRNTLSELLEEGLNLLTNSIIDYVHGDSYPNSHGLSIYFDRKQLDQTYPTTIWAQESRWLSLLETYHKITSY